MNPIIKRTIPHLIALIIFFAITSIYFAPSIFQGKTIQQSDMQRVYGMEEELLEYYEEEGGRSAWTGSMFSGMPSYHIKVYGNPPAYLKYIDMPIRSIDFMGASMILVALICFYILMCVMGVNRWLAIAGAIAYAFASYNFIIIAVGHITKMYVIAYMPLTIAGMVLLFKKKWLWGTISFLLGVFFSVGNHHLQITYYLMILCLFVFIGWLVNEIIKKEYSLIAKVTGIMVICVVLAILPTSNSLYANYELGQESMRGGSELTSADKKASSGLDIDYAFGWSYGKGELLTLLIPGAYGGSSGETLSKDSKFYKAYRALGANPGKNVQAPTYWGTQPGTSGPVYFGAIICFLFLLGMIVIKNPIKWWIAGATLFFILLSLGSNLLWFNEFLFKHMPLYSKFRVPAMALVIPGLTFPLIGLWGLKEIFAGKIETSFLRKALILSTSIVGGICLIIWLLPGTFLSFQSASDLQYQLPDSLIDALVDDRRAMASSDAFRSLMFILLSAALITFFLVSKNKKMASTVAGIGLVLLITVDLWGVDKRYLNDSMFTKQTLKEAYQPTNANKFILQDKSPSYRVLNMTGSTFNETQTSFFHKSIGGYHAAKLRRYQELIDHRIMVEMQDLGRNFQYIETEEDIPALFEKSHTLNMLNTKYIIINQDYAPITNPYAFGNAWFVEEVSFVDNPNQELSSLNNIHPLKTATIDRQFEGIVSKSFTPDSTANIELLEYKPDYLKYSSKASSEQVAVFSEIYYDKGWKAYIDGEETEHFRADWILRAMNVPAGEHTIEFRFIPTTYNTLTTVAASSSLVLLIGFIAALGFSIVMAFRGKGKE
ncbi:YfhO family protein [Bacteroidales bacterium OttesenSCG-928-I14]|nr:YfhO family protein [Bacteroidales bacterium OttesenSCG-928-I14]